MNVTLSIDDRLVEQAREVAQRQGTSLQEMIRAYLADVTGQSNLEASIERMRQLDTLALKSQAGNKRSPGRFDRDEIYAERLDRYGNKRPAR